MRSIEALDPSRLAPFGRFSPEWRWRVFGYAMMITGGALAIWSYVWIYQTLTAFFQG